MNGVRAGRRVVSLREEFFAGQMDRVEQFSQEVFGYPVATVLLHSMIHEAYERAVSHPGALLRAGGLYLRFVPVGYGPGVLYVGSLLRAGDLRVVEPALATPLVVSYSRFVVLVPLASAPYARRVMYSDAL